MKEKKFELVHLYREGGWVLAVCYNRLCGYYKEYRFNGYYKKDILYKLRNEYGVICRRGSY